jgi:hypothetical protein
MLLRLRDEGGRIVLPGSFIAGHRALWLDADRAMVEMIVHMAKVMGKEAVAECVENDGILF